MAYEKTIWVNDDEPFIEADNLNKIENELELLDTSKSDLLNAINNPTYTTTEGTNLSINNTRVGKMKFEYYGDTEQETTTGKNKIGTLTDFVANDTSAINVTYNTEANTITVKHLTTSAWKGIYKTLTGLTAGATMTISVYATTTTSTGWSLSVRNSGGTVIDETTHNTSGTETHLTFTVPNDGSITIRAYAGYGDVAVNDTATYSKFQLEYGSSVTAYEPYTGGIASPNPDYQQELKTVTGENTIDIVGKNLFNPKNIYLGKAWNNADNTARAIAYVPLTIGNTYTISMQNVSAVDMVLYNFSDTFTLPYSIAPNQITTTTTITATKKYLYFQFNKTNLTKNDILAIGLQVEKGSTASPYEEFKGQSYELNLASRNLINPNSPYLGASLGITSIYNSANQSISFSGTTTGTWAYLTNKINIKIPKGNYTFSINKSMSTNTVIIRMYYNDTQYQDVAININTTSRSMNITNDTIAYQIYMGGLTAGTTLNESLNFQLEKRKRCYTIQAIFHTYRIM